jgi:tRNA threonylcarbamoyladenosine dehydratase
VNAFEARFGGVARLFGWSGLKRLQAARVCVVGMGGVGSWAAEALARSGVGGLTLVDFDEVCISNVNRQLHAVTGRFGQPKVTVMAERLQAIHPDGVIHPIQAFLTASNAAEILSAGFDHVLDAIDQPAMKALLIARCRELNIRVTCAGAAGGRRDPTAIRVSDLSRVTHDRLLQAVRKILRSEHGCPGAHRRMGVDCVHSAEAVVYPTADGEVSTERGAADLRLDCRSGYGTAAFVTGAFGFAAASCVVRALAGSHLAMQSAVEAGHSQRRAPSVVCGD